MAETLTSHGRVQQIHGVVHHFQALQNAANDRIDHSVLPLEAVNTAKCPNADHQRDQIPKEKPRLHNLRTQAAIAAFDGHDLAMRAGNCGTRQPQVYTAVRFEDGRDAEDHSELRSSGAHFTGHVIPLSQRQMADCARANDGARKNPEIANPRGAEDSSYFRGRFEIRQGDRTVSIHASGAVPGDSPRRANRHVSCVAVSGEPGHVQRGGKVWISSAGVKTIS